MADIQFFPKGPRMFWVSSKKVHVIYSCYYFSTCPKRKCSILLHFHFMFFSKLWRGLKLKDIRFLLLIQRIILTAALKVSGPVVVSCRC